MHIAMIVQLALAWTGDPEPRLFGPGTVSIADGATAGEIERFRIQRHLALVEATLREETPTDLPPAQAQARSLMRPVLTLSADEPAYAALRTMRERRSHLTLVRDDSGLVGLLTLQDLLDRLLPEPTARASGVPASA